jgi:hypothetical protein
VVDGVFYGGTCGACSNFEVAQEGDRWMRFETDLATTPAGEPVLWLRGHSTLEVVYEYISEGASFDEKTECIEDLAAFLENSRNRRPMV